MAQLSFLVQNALADVAGEHDLSIIQMRLLGVLRDRRPTMNELGRLLGLDKSSISGLVDRAQRRGLMIRTPGVADRRVFQVSLTDTGRDLATQAAGQFTERVAALIGSLPADDRDLLAVLSARVVTADANRRGFDLGATS